MPDPSRPHIQARFISTRAGRLFTLLFEPQSPPLASWLFVPPFAEEMNRCRATVAATARALATRGHAVMLLDPSGTGESDGDFADATVSRWLEDIHDAGRALAEHTGLPTGLWGMRLGATLAGAAADQRPDDYPALMLWQPVQKGATFLTQFLRLRVAALMARNLPPEDTKSMREALAAGRILEVAGYPLGGRLADEIQALDMGTLPALSQQQVYWIEHVAAEGQEPGPASRKILETLDGQGCDPRPAGFTGPPFWQTHEIVQCPDVTRQTLSILGTDQCA